MPGCGSPFLTKKVVATVVDNEIVDTRQPPWQPILANASLALKPLPPPTEEEVAAWKAKQNDLAAQAQTRYETWLGDYPPPRGVDAVVRPATSGHPTHHQFRERRKDQELSPKHWSNPDRVAHERERIDAVLKSSLFMVHPPYPKAGGGIKNREFSYVASSYDYRQRMPSKEIAGTCSIMRTKPRTESERINIVLQVCADPRMLRPHCPCTRVHRRTCPCTPPPTLHRLPPRPLAPSSSLGSQDDSLRDAMAGGRWTFDPKYGNPPHCTPATCGSPFRSDYPQKWMRAARGGFEMSFPPGTADGQRVFLHHDEPYQEKVHPVVAPNVRCGSRQREPEKEMSSRQFSSAVPLNTYVPNPSKLCNWNVLPESPQLHAKSYRRVATTQTSYRAGLV